MHEVFFDGACDPNPGRAGYGVSLTKEGNEIANKSSCIGTATNNVAEYHGLVNALLLCIEKKVLDVVVYGDSLLVINQSLGKWKVKSEKLCTLCDVVKNLLKQFNSVELRHIKREGNKRADFLASSSIQLF